MDWIPLRRDRAAHEGTRTTAGAAC
jgi:hypothetical protein